MGLEMLLHVVGTGELFGASGKGALDRLLGGVNFAVPRRMTRGREGLFTSMALAIAARISLASCSGWAVPGNCGILLVRGPRLLGDICLRLLLLQKQLMLLIRVIVLVRRSRVCRVNPSPRVVVYRRQRRYRLVTHLGIV
jgi:hypothetical protein